MSAVMVVIFGSVVKNDYPYVPRGVQKRARRFVPNQSATDTLVSGGEILRPLFMSLQLGWVPFCVVLFRIRSGTVPKPFQNRSKTPAF